MAELRNRRKRNLPFSLRRFSRSATHGQVRYSYSRAFDEHSLKIDDALVDPVLDALAAARNVIVHRSGLMDVEYKSTAKRFRLLPKAVWATRFR